MSPFIRPRFILVAGLVICTAGVQQIVQAQDLYEADYNSGSIFKFTPGGTKSSFATGLSFPVGLAFDSVGNLYEADLGSNSINKFTPGGTESTFATGLSRPYGLAFDSVGNLYEADYFSDQPLPGSGSIFKFTPGGTESSFATGLYGPTFLAFAPASVTPEPGVLGLLLSAGMAGIGVLRQRRSHR